MTLKIRTSSTLHLRVSWQLTNSERDYSMNTVINSVMIYVMNTVMIYVMNTVMHTVMNTVMNTVMHTVMNRVKCHESCHENHVRSGTLY